MATASHAAELELRQTAGAMQAWALGKRFRGVLSAIAFHEKAGRSQVGSFVFSLDTVFSPAESPLSPPFHPHSWLSDFVRSVQVGCFSFQPVLPPDFRPPVPFLGMEVGPGD